MDRISRRSFRYLSVAAGLDRRALPLALASVVAIAAALRFRDLGAQSVWVDEAFSWSQSRGSLNELIYATANDNYPPLHNFLLFFVIRVFGDNEWALRAPSAVLGLLNVIAIYWVGVIFANRFVGVVAALFLALSGFHIWYSQDARMYTLLALSATLFVGTSVRLASEPSFAKAILAFICGLALLYSHPYGVFTWLAVSAAIGFCIHNDPNLWSLSIRQWFALQATVIIGFAPWAFILLSRANSIENEGFWLKSPTPNLVINALSNLSTGPFSLSLICLCISALGVYRMAKPPISTYSAENSATVVLLLAWAVVPIALGIAASIAVTPIFIDRYLMGSLPAILLLASLGLSRFVKSIRDCLIAIAISIIVLGISVAFYSPAPQRDWRSATAFLSANLGPRDCVHSNIWGGYMPLQYYHRQHIPCLTSFGLHMPFDQNELAGADRIFVVSKTGTGEQKALEGLPGGAWRSWNREWFRSDGIEILTLRRTD